MRSNFLKTIVALSGMLPLGSLSAENPDEILKRVQAHIVIGDYVTASQEAKSSLQFYPNSNLLWESYMRALGKSGDDRELMRTWQQYVERFPDQKSNTDVLETLAWGVIDKGAKSTTPIVRVTAILGAFFSQDARGISILQNALHDEHAFLRGAAVKLSSKLHDTALQDTVLDVLQKEKVWKVRLEAIQAVGKMRLEAARPILMQMIDKEELHIEEKTAAIAALVTMSDKIERTHVEKLAQSNRAGMRLLACELVAHYEQKEVADILYPLLKDHHADVRAKVYETLGRLRLETLRGFHVIDLAATGVNDPDPNVAVTSAWLLTLNAPQRGQAAFAELLNHSLPTVRHLAAAALSATGKYGFPLTTEAFQKGTDPYIKMNLAMGLIGQRCQVEESCACLYKALSEQREKWAWGEEGNFRVLAPSKVKHEEAIPNYPEAVNQLTRLEILQVLAVVHYPQAQQAIKNFLKESNWGITGLAAALLLTEGDEEAVDLVHGLLKDPDKKVKIQAALILAMWGRGEDTVQMLQEAYSTADRELKGQILEAIGRVGSRISLPFLAERLEEPFQSLRIIAAAALLECLYH